MEFVAATTTLGLLDALCRRVDPDDPDDPDSPDVPEWTSPWTLGGLLAGVADGWVTDTDWRGVRTNERRRLLLLALQNTGRRLVFGDREAHQQAFGLGQLAGVALYRFRYGVLGALPGDD